MFEETFDCRSDFVSTQPVSEQDFVSRFSTAQQAAIIDALASIQREYDYHHDHVCYSDGVIQKVGSASVLLNIFAESQSKMIPSSSQQQIMNVLTDLLYHYAVDVKYRMLGIDEDLSDPQFDAIAYRTTELEIVEILASVMNEPYGALVASLQLVD